MPEISRFLGMVVMMYHRDHGVPHFHVQAGGRAASFEIESLAILEGKLSPREHALIVEWGVQHRPELMGNWRSARQGVPLKKIAPLD